MNLIVPSKCETMCTGFELGAEKQIRGKLWRVELHRGGMVRVSHDGMAVTKATNMPHAVLDMIQHVRTTLASIHAIPSIYV